MTKIGRPKLTYSQRIAYFESRLKKVGTCLLWTGCAHRGHGVMFFPELVKGSKKRYYYTHVIAFYLAGRSGELTQAKPNVCHARNCNKAQCCNEEHLYAGSHQDNMNDRKATGGYNKPLAGSHHYAFGKFGKDHKSTRLTKKILQRMKVDHRSGKHTKKELGLKYGFHEGTIRRFLKVRKGSFQWSKLA